MPYEHLRIGIVGCDHAPHAASYISGLRQIDGVEVLALYDQDAERAQRFADHFSIPHIDASADALLARDEIDAVVVCSATSMHAAHVVAAARAGKHVLCEKPIATTVDDAQAMIAACAEAGVQLHIAFVCRFYPMVQAAKAMIDAGELGPVRGVLGGNRGRPPSALPWLTDPAQSGGGALIDHSVHVTDAMRFVLGDEVARVSAEAGTLMSSESPVEDCALLLLEFRSGTVASIDPSWSIPAANPFHYDFYLRILGADGLITLDDTKQVLQVASDRPESSGFVAEPFGINVDHAMVRHVVQSLREGQFLAPSASGDDGLRALEIALAAYESARTGQPTVLGQL